MITDQKMVRPGTIVSGAYSHESVDAAAQLMGAGCSRADIRQVAWGGDEEVASRISRLRRLCKEGVTTRLGRALTARDADEVDRRLEEAMRGDTSTRSVEHEADRVAMPHYGTEDKIIARQHAVRNNREGTSLPQDVVDGPEAQLIALVVELSLGFVAESSRDDTLFKTEAWRGHTVVDVVRGVTDGVPAFAPPRATMSTTKLSTTVDNPRMLEVSEQPLYPDGHPAWFAGWDQFFDASLPT